MSESKPIKAIDPAAIERGHALKDFLDRNKIKRQRFAREAQISRSSLYALLTGANDLALAETRTAQGLLLAMGIADADAHKMLNIPPEMRSRWRTVGLSPIIQDPAQEPELVTVALTQPLSGWVALPSGIAITINRQNKAHGILVVRLEDGMLYTAQRAMVPPDVEILGQLWGADFSTAQPGSPQTAGRPGH